MDKILAGLSVDQLKQIARDTYNDHRDVATIVFERVMIELERRLSIADFAKFVKDWS
jgi:hypothetical protein